MGEPISSRPQDRVKSVGLVHDQLVAGDNRIRWMHLAAFFAVALTFYARHASGLFTSCVKTCGLAGLLGSMLVWWPIVLSWLVVRQFPMLARSRGWQVIFLLTSVAMCVLYGLVSWERYTPFVVASIVHAIVLLFAAFMLSAARPDQ